MSDLVDYFTGLSFFIKGERLFYFCLICFSILIALFEGLNISILYPIISMSLGPETSLSPYPNIFSVITGIIPVDSVFTGLILIFLLLTAFLMIIQLLYWKLSYLFTMRVTVRVKQELYNRLFSGDYRQFEEKKQGELINLMSVGPIRITTALELLMGLIADISLTIVIILSLLVISPAGLVFVCIGGVVYYLINNIIGNRASKKLGKYDFDSQQREGVLINEYITGVRAISAANKGKHWERLLQDAILIYWKHYPHLRFFQRMPGLLMYSLFLFAIGFMTLFLSLFYAESFTSIIPIFGTYTVGLLRILPKVTAISYNFTQFIQYFPYIAEMKTFFLDTRFLQIQNGNTPFHQLNTDIVFDRVSFSYTDQRRILQDLSFIARKGEVTAIVGPSGTGKSTITSLLMRLYDPDNGMIRVNDVSLKEVEIGSFRDHIGYVGQEPFVFNASVRDNITFGGEYTDKEVRSAAALAHADSFIEQLPEGYGTEIGDRGLKLSGGEKQRIVIARAMIRKPELLILDEATASLDNIAEGLVQQAIDEVSRGCTTIVIAHRLTTIQNADRIIVLDQGRILEEGSHTELMGRKGLYWKMYIRSGGEGN